MVYTTNRPKRSITEKCILILMKIFTQRLIQLFYDMNVFKRQR